MLQVNTLTSSQVQYPIRPEYKLGNGPSFNELMHRYADQDHKYLNDPNYVPSLVEFRDLQMLGDDIQARPKCNVNRWEEEPETEMVFVGPHGVVDKSLAKKIKKLADPATWLRDEGDERLFMEAAGALEGRTGHPNRTEKEELELFNATEAAVVGTLFDTGSLTPEKLDRLAELSRVSRMQFERQGVDPSTILRRRSAARATGRAAVPGKGIGGPHVDPAKPVEGRISGQAKVEAKERRTSYAEEPDEDTLLRLLADSRVLSQEAVAAALYPEKMANGSSVYNKMPFSLSSLHRRALAKQAGRLNNLTEAEKARVAKLTRQLVGVKRLENKDTQDFRRGIDHVPAQYEISTELFPEAKNRPLTDVELNVVETVRARLERHHETLAKPDRFMWLRIRMEEARKTGVKLIADVKEFGISAKEFAGKNAGSVRVAGAAALALTVAVAVGPDARTPNHEGPKAVGTSTSQFFIRRNATKSDSPGTEQPPIDVPTAGRRPDGSSGKLEPIEVEYR